MISVIMSVYNCERYLSSAIESILNQSYKDIEFIIIDDCSTDNSLEIIRGYCEKDDRIKVIINKENIGLTKSLNKGLDIAKGQYIARQDADDISTELRLVTQLYYLKEWGFDLIGCKVKLINEKDCVIGKMGKYLNSIDIYKLLNKGTNPLVHGSIFFKNDKKLKYDPFFKYAQDYNFYLRNDFKIGTLPLYLYGLRIHDKSITINKFKEQRFYMLCAKHYDRIKNNIDNNVDNKKIKIESILFYEDIIEEYYMRIAWYYTFNEYDKILAIKALSECNHTNKRFIMLMFIYFPKCIIKFIHDKRKKIIFGKGEKKWKR